MLKVDNINLFYGAAQALRGVSIAAEPGSCIPRASAREFMVVAVPMVLQ